MTVAVLPLQTAASKTVDEQRRDELLKQTQRDLARVLSPTARLRKLRDISDEEWAAAESGDDTLAAFARKSSDQLVADLTNVQKLVHLAMRLDMTDEGRLRGEILAVRKRAYEDELSIQAKRLGCGSRRGRLTSGPELTKLNDESRKDAASIVETYNRELANKVSSIAAEVPTANRHVYARRLLEWDKARRGHKTQAISIWSEGTARRNAQQAFFSFNGRPGGVAVLRPTRAVCPVCKGWVARGEIDIRVAMNNPPPYHSKCPHIFEMNYEKVAASECADLWMGE